MFSTHFQSFNSILTDFSDFSLESPFRLWRLVGVWFDFQSNKMVVLDHLTSFSIVFVLSSTFLETSLENGLGLPIGLWRLFHIFQKFWTLNLSICKRSIKKNFLLRRYLKNASRLTWFELKIAKMAIFGNFSAMKDMMINMENDQLDELYNPRIVVFWFTEVVQKSQSSLQK